MKLINVEEFISSYCSGCESRDALCESGELCDMFRYILNFPSVDAVPVVRCKNCVYYEKISDIFGHCVSLRGKIDWLFTPNDFCSYGEKDDLT